MPEICRCPWVDLSKPDYIAYHDHEWGVPVHDDRRFFEFIVLEAAQAGLSWYTILRRREGYRRAFDDFDPEAVARFDAVRVAALLQDTAIIRNRAKIESAIANARCFLRIKEEFGSFDAYIWRFVGGAVKINDIRSLADYPVTSPEADDFSRDARGRGFRFLGATTCYAYLQATGLVNDHSIDCFRRLQVATAVPEPPAASPGERV